MRARGRVAIVWFLVSFTAAWLADAYLWGPATQPCLRLAQRGCYYSK